MRSLPDVRMLIGVGDYKSCKGKSTRCVDCEVEYIKTFMRLIHHAEHFPEFKWKMSTELHLKCALFFYQKRLLQPARVAGVAGGRNFTDSSWADVTFELSTPDVKKLYAHTSNLWENAKPLTDDTAEWLFESQEISRKALEHATV